MPDNTLSFDLAGKVAVVTGGYGVIGGMIADGLARAHACVVVVGRHRDRADCGRKKTAPVQYVLHIDASPPVGIVYRRNALRNYCSGGP